MVREAKTKGRSAAEAKAVAAGAAPQEDDIIRDFRNVTYWVLGEPRELHAVWKSTDSDGTITGEKAHLHIAPARELYPATAELQAMVLPAVDDASESLSQGIMRSPESLPGFPPIIPVILDFGEKAQLSRAELAERNKMEQTVLKKGTKYLMAVSRLLDMPGADVIEITKGSEKNPPLETLRVSPTELLATASLGEFGTRTARFEINRMDGSIDLCVTDRVVKANGQTETTEKGGIEGLIDAKAAVESFFPGFEEFFQVDRPTKNTPKPTPLLSN